MSENNKVAKRIVADVNNAVVPKVRANGKIIKDILDQLERIFHSDQNADFKFNIMHGGSAYESLAVEEKVDFDITLTLLKPFGSENFDIGRDPSGFYTLRWKSTVAGQRLADSNGYLSSSQLRKAAFRYLRQSVARISLPGIQINCYDAASAFTATVVCNTGQRLKLDLVPQIACRTWSQCPDLKPLHEMPTSLQRYINTLCSNASPIMFFSLGIPNADSYSNSDRLFSVSFSMLEKEFLRSNIEIRDMIRLVKYTAKLRGWDRLRNRADNVKMKFPFKSFYAKRVAVKYYDSLNGKDIWDGYLDLLGYISHELHVNNRVIDGYFVKKQSMKQWKPEEVKAFKMEVDTLRGMNANQICYDKK